MTELMHPDAARLSSTSVHRAVADATHQSLIDDKERRDSIEPLHRRGRHSGADEAWLIPMRPTAPTRRLATP